MKVTESLPDDVYFMEEEPEIPCVGFATVKRYFAGKKEFKTEWGAWCHLAKMDLLEKVNVDARRLRVDKSLIFKDRYPSRHHRYGDHIGYSDFFEAVQKRARELREQARTHIGANR